MREYKEKNADRTVKAVQYDGSYGQKRGISFHLVRKGFTTRFVGETGIGLVNKDFPEGRVGRILKPGMWLLERSWRESARTIQFMEDADFRKAFEVTHG